MWTVDSVAYGIDKGVAALGLGGREVGKRLSLIALELLHVIGGGIQTDL